MLYDILIDPETGRDYVNVPPKVAAKFLGVRLPTFYLMMQESKLPIGAAARTAKGVWCYMIPCERLKAYAAAADLKHG